MTVSRLAESVRWVFALVALRALAHGQGTFIYDQQSSTNETTIAGGTAIQQLVAPYGQSFTPALSSIGFIRLKLNDRNPGNALGATLYVNLRTDSIGGVVLSSTTPVALADSFTGTVNFFLPSAVPLTPGIAYHFQPVAQSGDQWNLDAEEYNYPRGSAFYQGSPLPGSDYWFREGQFVPEPPAVSLIAIGASALCIRAKPRPPRFHDNITPA